MYVDTSFAVSLYLIDENSERAADFMDYHRGALVVSDWMVLEFLSVLSRDVRKGFVSPDLAPSVQTSFFDWLSKDCQRETPLEEHFVEARELLERGQSVLRAPDALHLAMCKRWGLSLLTFDKGLIRAAQAHGVQVAPLYD